MGEWFDAEIKLPKERKRVIVIASGKPSYNLTLKNAYEIAEWDSNNGWVLEKYPDCTGLEVYYWMYFPKPPKDGD